MPSIDNGQMFARQRELFYRADSNRAALWDAIGNTVSTLKAHGAKPQQVMQAIDQPLAALRKLTASSGRDPDAITGELAMLFGRPSPQPAPVQSASRTVQQAAPPAPPDFHLNDIPDAHIDAAIDRAFEGMGA